MTDLFNKEDILTGVTADQAVIGMKGFFGNSVDDLISKIKQNDVKELSDISSFDGYCFMNEFEHHYTLFLPLDKVKTSHTYRPLDSIDELFDFLLPDFDANDRDGNKVEIDTNKKAEILLGRKITLRCIINDRITAMVIQDVDFYRDGSDVFLNGDALDYLSNAYEILINGEFVPFKIEIEEQESERSEDKEVDNSLSDFMDKRIKEISEEE